jgi:lipopolysaccharide/colanic/teichoic acid biosynthesis glycosyltransferase
VYADDRGPVFFIQHRAGRMRAPIRVFKFRTMEGSRITRVGRWLRATGIDEIPQFINVFRGEMSVVGPRPLTEDDIDRLGWNAPRYAKRWEVRPGITGLAQLYGGHSARISWYLDRRYLKIQSVRLDAAMVFLSFVINLVGKKRIRRWLRGRG